MERTCNILTRVKHRTVEQLLIVDITSQRKGASVTVIDMYAFIHDTKFDCNNCNIINTIFISDIIDV